ISANGGERASNDIKEGRRGGGSGIGRNRNGRSSGWKRHNHHHSHGREELLQEEDGGPMELGLKRFSAPKGNSHIFSLTNSNDGKESPQQQLHGILRPFKLIV
ncbi:unnamed protein product, partial [Brassica rapa subsp. narinosa]